ncbi:MAG: ferritin-like domain-containing protein, partial [Myxococcota bacterium]|nr:ferritin-like domain-containing protein [Myxococcota bacterium]
AAASDRILGPVELPPLDLGRHRPDLVELARRVWSDRVRSEFRSIQILARFLSEVVGAGDPVEVYAPVADLVLDEIRHVRLCAALCERLGARPVLPDPVELRDPAPFLAAPMAERALHTAIAMLCINETLSVAFVEDLRARCDEPAVRYVLDATLADEATHDELGWEYARRSLRRFPPSTLPDWRHLVRLTLEPHQRFYEPIVRRLDAEGRSLAHFDEPELVALGLLSPERQALLARRAVQTRLLPRLAELGLAE